MSAMRGTVGWGRRDRGSRRDFASTVRQRPVEPRTKAIMTNTSTSRRTLMSPKAGRRIRIHQIKLIQLQSDGIRECELYFGTAANMVSAGEGAIDLLRVGDRSETSTRTWDDRTTPRGPLGGRNEVLSQRWLTSPGTGRHQVIVLYSEEG